jgi:hypothetical protein
MLIRIVPLRSTSAQARPPQPHPYRTHDLGCIAEHGGQQFKIGDWFAHEPVSDGYAAVVGIAAADIPMAA